MVTKGDIYERDVRDSHVWRTERRLILDATEQVVLYQVLYDEPEGTCVERDYVQDQKQTSMKKWRAWAKLATKIE